LLGLALGTQGGQKREAQKAANDNDRPRQQILEHNSQYIAPQPVADFGLQICLVIARRHDEAIVPKQRG
jgi:hypothetical protein